MSIIDDLIGGVALPRMVPVRQVFDATAVADVAAAVRAEIAKPAVAERIRPGMTVALGVGSRGLADLPVLVAETVAGLRALGAHPFVVPAMGSHGGATDAGQAALLATLGVTEESAGCTIRSSMEVVEIGRLPNGLPILMDAIAMSADGIAVINRIKPHTSFSGPVESGLAKMLTIGLGKQKGADGAHQLGFGTMAANVVDMAAYKIAHTPILFGLATVENAYDRIRRVEAVPAADILRRESELLIEAKASMPRILFNPLDVLVVDRMGKEYSGTGTDPNITGRAATPYLELSQQVNKMAVLDLSAKSRGNAAGMGFADITTRRLVDKIDYEATYANHITSTVLSHARIPVIMENDLRALQLAVKTCNCPLGRGIRMVRLANTLHLEHLLISEAMLEEAGELEQVEIAGQPQEWAFDGAGNLTDFDREHAG